MTQPIEKEKFLSLVLKHKKIIYKICNSYCKQAEDRKDLVQEILIQLWKSSGRYDPQHKLSTWIYRIALNVAISFYRSESRRKQKTALFDQAILHVAEDDNAPRELDSQIELLYRFIDSPAR